MIPRCPSQTCFNQPPRLQRHGSYIRKSDSKSVSRWRCVHCKKTISSASVDPCFGQKKRRVNPLVQRLLCSGVSMRRIAKLLRIHQTTVERKLVFLARQGLLEHQHWIRSAQMQQIESFQFDEMETSEHTKLKPLSIALAVSGKGRKILGFEVSQMPATGHLASKSLQKYGFRQDQRAQGLGLLFQSICRNASSACLIQSDQKPLYAPMVKKYFPESIHIQHKGRRGCVVGQGELKRGGYDPLFVLNHTCAMFRANVNRLFRRTWCTTKKRERLTQHLILYMNYHNHVLT